MKRNAAALLVMIASLLPFRSSPVGADHTPLNPDGVKWKNATGADFNLEIAWTQGYAAQGAAFQQRVRDVVARDPSCYAGTCTSTSYARWYLHQAQPYFGGAESTVADFDPSSGTPASRCGTEGGVSFHWRTPVFATSLGETHRCSYGAADPTRVFSSQVVVNPNPPSPGTLDIAAINCVPGPYVWFTAGPADANNDAPTCRTYDLMSVLAHEVGHVLGFGEYRTDGAGANSVDPVCLNGSATEDPRLGNNTNRETMCIPIFSGTERQRTPEEHEKAALAKLYPPTGPAPTITPAAQPTEPRIGVATWSVSVPRDPARDTSFHMVYGDGTYDTRSVPQGSGSASFTISHPYTVSGTYTPRATVVETGAFAAATLRHTSSSDEGATALKGRLSLSGNAAGSGTVVATGKGTSMAQCIDGGVAKVTQGDIPNTDPAWTIRTDPYAGGTCAGASTLSNGDYKVMYYNNDFVGVWGERYHGYSGTGTSRTWETDCMIEADLLTGYGRQMGTVTITSGVITASSNETGFSDSAVSSGNVTFTKHGNLQYDDAQPDESAICIASSNLSEGNMAPFTVL